MKNDTISKAAAVSEIESIVDTMSVCISLDECKGMRRMKKTVLERIEALPPAPSEYTVVTPEEIAAEVACESINSSIYWGNILMQIE